MEVVPAHPEMECKPSPAGVPLFHAAWLFAAGIAATHWLWLRPGLVLCALFVLLLASLVAIISAPRTAWFSIGALWLLTGYWCAQVEPLPTPSQPLLALADGLLRNVDGTITDLGPVRNADKEAGDSSADAESTNTRNRLTQRVDLQVSSVESISDSEDRQTPVQAGLRLTVQFSNANNQSSYPVFHCGDRLRAVVRLYPPESFRDPGVWSRKEYLLDQGITTTASVPVEHIEILRSESRGFSLCRIHQLQHQASSRLLALSERMRAYPRVLQLTASDAAMLSAMIAGDRTYLTHALRVGFERTGSFHMLVVSGFHLAVVAGFVFWIARRLHVPNLFATMLTIPASFAYALFTGFATPVQRSFWMVAMYLVGRLLYREKNIRNTIGFASLCLLVASPRALFDSSFQMTLLAVVSIGGIAVPLLKNSIHPYLVATRDLKVTAIDMNSPRFVGQFRVLFRMLLKHADKGYKFRGKKYFLWIFLPWCVRTFLRTLEFCAVSLIVELAMSLPMAMYFHRITLFAMPANLFILPLLAILIPAALVLLLTAMLWPAAAAWTAMIAAFLLHLGLRAVHTFGSLPLAEFRIPDPLVWQAFFFYVLLGAALLFAYRTHRVCWYASWLSLAIAALCTVAPRTVDHPRNALLVEAIDVGQGDSLLLITPEGKTLLIDGGGFGGGPRGVAQDYDIGEEVVSPALWARGIRQLDVVALSHAHADHIGGLPAVLRNFHPKELWVGKNPPSEAYRALLGIARQYGTSLHSLRAGDALTLGSTHVQTLAPFDDYQPGIEPSNNDSLVLRAQYKSSSVLLEGDAEEPIEERMLQENNLQSTLLKVGHHGSITSSTPEFLDRVHAQWAVISCGRRNRFHHPRIEVLTELETRGVRTFRTDMNGATCFLLDGTSALPQPFCRP